jgi:flagellar biosynthesis/type III secretory pathway chaperone
MDIHDNTTKQAYIQLLIDTLEKKKKILNWLMNVTEQQDEIMTSDAFDGSLFDQTINIKGEHLQSLTMLDEGFEKIYEAVRDELSVNKSKYESEIKTLQVLITDITDLSVKLQALEKRNKAKMDFVLSKKRKEIRDTRLSSKTVANYYKTMNKQNEIQSIFYDKKK